MNHASGRCLVCSCRFQAASAFGAQHGVQPLCRQVGDDAVVQHTGRVDDTGQRVVRRDGCQDGGELVRLRGVAGLDGDVCAETGQFFDQSSGIRRQSAPSTREQEQVGEAALGDQVSGDQGAECSGAAGDQDRPSGSGAAGGRVRTSLPVCRA